MLGENYSQRLRAILLSNNTESASEDIMKQLLTQITFSPKFASHVNEITDTVALW